MRRGAPLTVLAIAALALPGASEARVLKAGDVLPPGQSGHVSISGLPNGEGSPHLQDQTDLFLRFQFKPHGFDQPPGTVTPTPGQNAERPLPGVQIVRDAYGVPAITADTEYDLWFGAGYAVAQDRLFQLELFRRATTGRLSEILGKGYLEDDIKVRRDFYRGSELDAQLAKLPLELQQRFVAYRDGVNAWIAEAKADPPGKMPGEFTAVGLPEGPAPWTVRDSAAIGVYLARTVPNGDGEELPNARGLKAVGARLFTRILPLRVPGQVPTVPRSEGYFPSQPGRTRRQEIDAFKRSRRFIAGLPLPSREDEEVGPGRFARAAGLGRTGGSNMWAIRSRGGRATLFNGPQLGWSIPELFVEFELDGPGYKKERVHVRGVTAAGIPLIGIGHNGRVAWGFTSGLTDENDLYVEQLVGDEAYRYHGKVLPMECRDETFPYRPPPTDLLGLLDVDIPDPDSAGTHVERVCRTHHGPVQVRAHGRAYARRYATWKREVETLEGLVGVNEAASVKEVDVAMRRITWNENLMAADDKGHIGYWHPGLLPRRSPYYDERLPFTGTGGAEWRGFLPVSRRPHVIDPKQGFLFQWNTVPSAGWTIGDGPAKERLGGPLHRGAWLARQVKHAFKRGGGYTNTARVDRFSGSYAQQRPLSARRLIAARREARGSARTVLNTILAWDGNYDRTNSEGKVSAGVAAWDHFAAAAKRVALGRYGEGVDALGHSAGSSHRMEVTSLESWSLRNLGSSGYRRAAADAFRELTEEFGSSNPANWRRDRLLYDPSSQGAASMAPFPFFDRGTWQHVVALGP